MASAPPDGFTDLDALRVHGDALLEAGDPRGELIALGFARQRDDGPRRLETPDDRSALAAREDALIADETARLDALLTRHMVPQYRWRLGFVEAIAFEYAGDEAFDALPVLAAEPAFRLLRRLEIGACQMDGSGDMAPIFAELAARAAAFPHLVEIVLTKGLDLGNPWIDGPIDIHDVAPLLRAFPRLEILELGGDDAALGAGPIALPRLRRLLIHGLAFDDARVLAAAQLPELVELELAFGAQRAEGLERLEPLFDAAFPRLATLAFSGPPLAMPHILDRLPRSRLAQRVRRLQFRQLADAWVPLLLTHAAHLRTLDAVEITDRKLPPQARAALRGALGDRLVLAT